MALTSVISTSIMVRQWERNGDMWHFEFEAPVGTRILSSRFFGITHFSLQDLWWSYTYNKWLPLSECNGNCSNTNHIRSFKAFKRHLRKHPELRSCGEVVLQSRYVGHSIKAYWREQ